MIINIAHTKGGVGKSTIATNLAIEMGADLLDLDTQNSSIGFSLIGPKRKIRFIKGQGLDDVALQNLDGYKCSKKNHLIVDSGGYDSNEIRRMLVMADMIITPVAVSQVELMGLKNFDQLVHVAKGLAPQLKAYVLFNRVTRFQKDDLAAFKAYIHTSLTDYEVLNTEIGDRKAFKDAFAAGLSVCELKSNSLAAKEINSLVKEIIEKE